MMTPDELLDMARSLLSSKDQVMKALFEDISQCETQANGCSRVLENWDKVQGNPENLEKQLKTAVKCVNRLSVMNRRLLMLLVVYVTGDNFTTDSALLMNKLGAGEEALKEMLKQKMKGKI